MPKEIELLNGGITLVDDEDFENMKPYRWRVSKIGNSNYVTVFANNEDHKRKMIYLHRMIMEPPEGMVVDHINGDGLDNRRSNLRVCTNAENCRNAAKRANCSSRFKGVYWFKPASRWCSRIVFNYKKIALGYFNDEVQAAKAYDTAALKYFGEFAKLNFPKDNHNG